jgi:hypothetical protein
MRQHADSLIFFFSIVCGSFTLVSGDRLRNANVKNPVEDFEITGRNVVTNFPCKPLAFPRS